jgi:WD40 repeat protein
MLPELSNNTQNHGLYKSFAETLGDTYNFEIKRKHNLGVRFVFYDKSNHTLIISYSNTNRVHVLDLSTGKLRFFDHHENTVRNINVTNNSDEIVTASWDGSICLTNTYDLKLRLKLTEKEMGRSPHATISQEYIFSYTYDSDRNVERRSNTVRQWNISNGLLINTFILDGTHLATRRCGSCEIYNNRLLYTVSDTGYLEAYNIDTCELKFKKFFNDLLQSLCIIPEYKMLALAGDNGTIVISDLSGRVITRKIKAHRYYISQLFRHPTNPFVIISVSWDSTVKFWRLPVKKSIWKSNDLELIGTVNVEGETSLWSATIINDLLVCGGESSNIQIFDIQNMAEPKFKGKLDLLKDSFALLTDSNTFFTNNLSMIQVRNKDRTHINDEKQAEYVLRANNNFTVFRDFFRTEEKKMEELQNKSFGFLQLTR